MGAGDMAFMIGQCCVAQIVTPPPGGGSGTSSGVNELIPFTNVATLTIAWNASRISRFGNAAVMDVYIQGSDGVYRKTIVDIVPNNILNPTSYTIDMGGLATGLVIIT